MVITEVRIKLVEEKENNERLHAFCSVTFDNAFVVRDLKIIDEPLFKALFDEFKEKGWRDPPYQEPASLKKEFPRRFQRLCFRALAEKAISESKAAELLGTNVRKLSALMEHGATEH